LLTEFTESVRITVPCEQLLKETVYEFPEPDKFIEQVEEPVPVITKSLEISAVTVSLKDSE
jgi:hypothetical protein